MYCVGGSLKNLCHFEMGGGGLANADVIRGGRSMLTVADRGEGGINFAKILLTSYVNAPLVSSANNTKSPLVDELTRSFI